METRPSTPTRKWMTMLTIIPLRRFTTSPAVRMTKRMPMVPKIWTMDRWSLRKMRWRPRRRSAPPGNTDICLVFLLLWLERIFCRDGLVKKSPLRSILLLTFTPLFSHASERPTRSTPSTRSTTTLPAVLPASCWPEHRPVPLWVVLLRPWTKTSPRSRFAPCLTSAATTAGVFLFSACAWVLILFVANVHCSGSNFSSCFVIKCCVLIRELSLFSHQVFFFNRKLL